MDPIVQLLTRHHAATRDIVTAHFRHYIHRLLLWTPDLTTREIERELTELIRGICQVAFPQPEARMLALELTLDVVADVLRERQINLGGRI